MNELRQVRSLLESWEKAAVAPDADALLAEILKAIQAFVPLDSLVIQFLDRRSRSLETIGGCGSLSAKSVADASVVCSEAKWNSIEAWAKTGEVLVQAGPRRAGKLSTLTPPTITGETLALPLRHGLASNTESKQRLGASVFEIGSNRVLREEQIQYLTQWSPLLWFVMNRAIEERWPEETGLGLSTESTGTRAGVVDEAREAIVGSDTGLRAVMERVQMVAPSDMPVLILGETGTGKEVVARAIHGRSPRHARPFVRVNCGAIPTELIDSQLFGHERGSFTGASDQRKGWFERADGGTLFLDEIGELPLAAQVRLLRVLQEHQIERVGGQENIHVDVRIVAATHRDLSAMVHQRTFREDLWYRVNMFPILLPGLRERVEDIPSLARHFARRAAHRFGLPYVEPTHADVKQLMDYRWPGNIRELQAVIDRAVILGGGVRLDVSKSLGNMFIQPIAPPADNNEPTFYEVIPESLAPAQEVTMISTGLVEREEEGPIDSLDSAMVRHIERALAATGGQVEGPRGAAKMLGINPHTLRAKMRKLKIDWNRFRRYQ